MPEITGSNPVRRLSPLKAKLGILLPSQRTQGVAVCTTDYESGGLGSIRSGCISRMVT